MIARWSTAHVQRDSSDPPGPELEGTLPDQLESASGPSIGRRFRPCGRGRLPIQCEAMRVPSAHGSLRAMRQAGPVPPIDGGPAGVGNWRRFLAGRDGPET